MYAPNEKDAESLVSSMRCRIYPFLANFGLTTGVRMPITYALYIKPPQRLAKEGTELDR